MTEERANYQISNTQSPPPRWTHPRAELIQTGVELARRGYNIMSIAEHMVTRHFNGRNAKSAERHLAAAIARQFYLQHAGRTERQEEIANMADLLRREGWKPLFDDDDERCFWFHKPTSMSVNCNGGFFYNYAAATRAAFDSVVRALLQEEP